MNRRQWRQNKPRPKYPECLICRGPDLNCNCYDILAGNFGQPFPGSIAPMPERIEIGEVFQFRGVGLEIVDLHIYPDVVKKAYISPGPQVDLITLIKTGMHVVFRKKEFKYKFSY